MTTEPAEDMKKRYCLAEGFTDKFERDLNKKEDRIRSQVGTLRGKIKFKLIMTTKTTTLRKWVWLLVQARHWIDQSLWILF